MPAPDLIVITEDTTRVELEAALISLRAAQLRAPVVMREAYHARYDRLLDAWEATS